MNKAQLVAKRLTEIEDRFGPAATRAAQVRGSASDLPGTLYHGPITSAEQAQKVGNYMAEFGNYPPGMSLCYVAGINGDSPDRCLFAGTEHCTCED